VLVFSEIEEIKSFDYFLKDYSGECKEKYANKMKMLQIHNQLVEPSNHES